jgi:hypothetical protein
MAVRIPELQSMNRLLYYASEAAVSLRNAVASRPAPEPCHEFLKPAINRYDHFLTEYEKYLRRIPSLLGDQTLAAQLGTQTFFRHVGQLH